MSDDSIDNFDDLQRLGSTPDDLPDNPSLSYNPRSFSESGPYTKESSTPTFHLSTPGYVLPENLPESPSISPPTPEDSGFSLLKTIGVGGMGEVWEAVQKSLWRIVAIKTIKGRGKGMSVPAIQSVLQSFKGEARTSALLDHPNIVPVYDLGFDEHGIPQLAMKLVKGVSWDKLMSSDYQKMDRDTFLMKHLQILVQVTQAVAFAHSRGVVHRDLKPGQVMIGSFGEVLLMDWGLALMLGDSPLTPKHQSPTHIYPTRETVSNPSGTPGYMAPEQTEFTGSRIGFWTDVYLLGGILYTVLTGRLPHPGKTSREAFRSACQGIVTPFEESSPDHPPPNDLRDLVFRALSMDRTARPTAKEFLEHLQDFLSGATNRRESELITRAVGSEPIERTYAGFVAVLSRLGAAMRLWPGNPDGPRLVEWAVEGYAKLALQLGDLTLARAQAERLHDDGARTLLLSQIDQAHARVIRQRRRVKQFATAAFVLLATIIVGGSIFTYQLGIAKEEVSLQLAITTEAKEAEARAKKSAEQASERATLLLADSLISQQRKDEAISELLRIPEGGRYWEWGFVLTRALEDLWTIPFPYLEWSPSKDYALGFNPDEGFCVLRAESGQILAKLSDVEPQGLVAAFSQDESRLLVGASNLVPTVIDTRSWAEVATFQDVTSGSLSAAEFSPDATRVALGTSTGNLVIATISDKSVKPLASHPRLIKFLYWGSTRLISASQGIVRRDDPEAGGFEILLSSRAIDVPYRSFNIKADRRRRFFAVGYYRERISFGRIDEGGLTILQYPLNDFTIGDRNPYLVVSGGGFIPTLLVHDMENNRNVPLDDLVRTDVGAVAGSGWITGHIGNIQLTADENCLLHLTEGIFRLVDFPRLRSFGPPLEIRDVGRTVLMPHGRAVWIIGNDGRTHVRPLGSPYVGTESPGSSVSFGQGDQYTSSLRESWFEQRDVASGELTFIGGRSFNWYMGGRTTTDGGIIYMPGRRHDQVLVEKTERSTGKILSTYFLNEPFADLEVFPDTASLALLGDDLTNITMLSLTDETSREVFRKQLEDDQCTGISFTPAGDGLALITAKGRLQLWDAGTGELRLSVDAHDGVVNALSYARSRKQWVTTGRDNHIRMWGVEDLKPGPDLAYDFEVLGMAMSPDGRWLLAWPERGEPDLREIETGKLISRLDRSDFPMYGVRFLDNNARIVASFQRAARFWDPFTGRETFNIDNGFGEVSSDFKKLIYKESDYDGTLIDIVPAREEDLPGAIGLPYRERLDLWMIERYKRWSELRVRRQLPTYLDLLKTLDGTVDGPAAPVAIGMLGSGIEDTLSPHAARRLAVETMGSIWMSQSDPNPPWLRFGIDGISACKAALEVFPDIANAPAGRAIADYCARKAMLYDEFRGKFDDNWIVNLRSETTTILARLFELRGERELALMIARRACAIRMISGHTPDGSVDVVRRLAGELPAPPPPELVLRQGVGAPLFVLNRLPPNLNMDTPEALADAERAAWEDYGREWEKYLAATPSPDWAAMLEKERASPEWKGLPEGTTFRDVAAELQKRIEPLVYDGMTLQQAREAERSRVEELFQWKRRAVAKTEHTNSQ